MIDQLLDLTDRMPLQILNSSGYNRTFPYTETITPHTGRYPPIIFYSNNLSDCPATGYPYNEYLLLYQELREAACSPWDYFLPAPFAVVDALFVNKVQKMLSEYRITSTRTSTGSVTYTISQAVDPVHNIDMMLQRFAHAYGNSPRPLNIAGSLSRVKLTVVALDEKLTGMNVSASFTICSVAGLSLISVLVSRMIASVLAAFCDQQIQVNQRSQVFRHHQLLSKKPPKGADRIVPEKPPKGADRIRFFEYKLACEKSSVKYTHEDLARDLGIAHGTARNLYSDWIAGVDTDP